MNKKVFIVSMARTPIGAFNGALSELNAIQLGAIAVKGALQRAGIDGNSVDALYLGNVLQANNGQAPARQVALAAGISANTPCTTINKVCASGMKSIIIGTQDILLGDADVVVVGGFESMSNAPYYIPQGRNGMHYGNKELVDAIVRDGLQDPYKGYMMGSAAEICAETCNIPRERQDSYAHESYMRAKEAYEKGYFADELIAVEIPQRKGNPIVVDKDEECQRYDASRLSTLAPAFKKDGTVTAINASKINDGAAAIVLMSEEKMKSLGLQPLAEVVSYADAEQEPEWFTTTPAKALPKALKKAGLSIDQIDKFEINEAFSVVALANMDMLNISSDKLNVLGGAVSLGHPIGASGARIICTLISALRHKGGKHGAAAICNGGGGASAIVIRLV